MAWTETDRVQIRHYLGFSAIFLQADPRLELAITAVQQVSDGGARPDTSTEAYIRSILTQLQELEWTMRAQWALVSGTQVGKITADAARGLATLRSEGRRLVNAIARQLATHPRADIFSNAPTNPYGDTFYGLSDGYDSQYRW